MRKPVNPWPESGGHGSRPRSTGDSHGSRSARAPPAWHVEGDSGSLDRVARACRPSGRRAALFFPCMTSRWYSSLLKSVATRFLVRPDRPITTIRRPCPVGHIYPAPETSGGTADDRPALFLRRASGVATRLRADVRIARLNRLPASVAGRPDSRLG